jgi:hypothetical protein
MTEPNANRDFSILETQGNENSLNRQFGQRNANVKSIELKSKPEAYKPQALRISDPDIRNSETISKHNSNQKIKEKEQSTAKAKKMKPVFSKQSSEAKINVTQRSSLKGKGENKKALFRF